VLSGKTLRRPGLEAVLESCSLEEDDADRIQREWQRFPTHVPLDVIARICSRTGDGSQARQGRVRVAYRMRPSYFGSRRSAADEPRQGHVRRRLGTRGARRRHLAHVRISMRCRSRVGAPSLPLYPSGRRRRFAAMARRGETRAALD